MHVCWFFDWVHGSWIYSTCGSRSVGPHNIIVGCSKSWAMRLIFRLNSQHPTIILSNIMVLPIEYGVDNKSSIFQACVSMIFVFGSSPNHTPIKYRYPLRKMTKSHLQTYVREEPAVSYRWSGWVWKITGWSWRLSGELPNILKESIEEHTSNE